MSRTSALSRAALVALTGLAACGYRVGLIAPEGFHSVGVEIFHNATPEPDLERALHAAISHEVRNRVPLTFADPSDSDLLIRGRITEFSRVRGIRDRDNQLLESGVRIVAEAYTVRRSSGEHVSPKTTARATIGYPVGSASGERAARQRALRHLARVLTIDLFTRSE
jgi:hypothetical protein